jgi:hypothetical protein
METNIKAKSTVYPDVIGCFKLNFDLNFKRHSKWPKNDFLRYNDIKVKLVLNCPIHKPSVISLWGPLIGKCSELKKKNKISHHLLKTALTLPPS